MSRFEFRFRRVEQAVKTVREEHPRASEPMLTVPQDDLTALIERVKSAPTDSYDDLADGLSQREATLLVHAYQRKLSGETYAAITTVLALRPIPRQLTQAWFILRNHPDLAPLIQGMRQISEALSEDRIGDDAVLRALLKIWSAADHRRVLVDHVADHGGTLSNWCQAAWPRDLAIVEDSPLCHRMKGLVLALGSIGLVQRHAANDLAQWFRYVPASLWDDAAANYIQSLQQSDWSMEIIEQAVNRHGLPASGGDFWKRIDGEKRRAIQRLIAGRLIAEFFRDVDDPMGRFSFWQRYVDYLAGIAYPPDRERVLLHFQKLIVVEFRDLGNAGYVYEERHRREVEDIVTSRRPHADCKIPEIAIHRIPHIKNWQQNTHRVLRSVLD